MGICYSCGRDDVEVKESTQNKTGGKVQLCKICRNTHIGLATIYPGSDPNESVLRSLGWIANEIIQEIRNVNDG